MKQKHTKYTQINTNKFIGATTVGTGETGPQLLGWGPTMYCPQLLGRSFRKAKNFTAVTKM